MRTLSILFIAICLLVAGCGEDEAPPERTTRVTPEPSADPTAEPGPAPPAPPTETPEAPAPVAEDPQPSAPEPDRAIPVSPPLPAPPADPTRAHVFSVPERDEDECCPEFGDEDALSEGDIEDYRALFIPGAALRPSEHVEIPWPIGRNDDEAHLTIRFPEFRYADARLTRLVNERVAAFARAQSRPDARGVDCNGIATAHLVSIHCSTERVSQRAMYDVEAAGYSAMTWRIEGGALRPMAIAEAFVPGADLRALVRQSCLRPEDVEDDQEREFYGIECATDDDVTPRLAFGSDGIVLGADDANQEWMRPGVFIVRYDELAQHLLARGPLAESLYRRRANTRETQIDPARRAPAPTTRSVRAIGPMSSSAEAAMRWLRLPAAQRDALQLLDGYLIASSPEVTQAAASALGVSAREVQVPASSSPVTLRAMQATRETPLRAAARRTAPIDRTLPRGALLVAIGDAIDGHVRVFATADADGYADARAIGPADACTPDLAPVIAALPEGARASAPVTTMRVFTRQAGGARAIFATELGTSVHVELHRVSDACAVERRIAAFDIPGERLVYLGLTHTERRAGQALIVTVGEGEQPRLEVHAYEGGRSIFSEPLDEGQRAGAGRSEGDAWYPVVILDADGEQVGALVWSGETITRAP